MTEEITARGPIAWDEGGTAQVRSAKDVDVVLRSSVPYPPGKPARGTLTTAREERHTFTAKVARSQRVAEGVWDVRAKLQSATTAVRLAFAESVALSGSGS
jgi:hypothetical protein